MDGQVLGGGVIVVVAVGLWLAYLVPSWLERQRFEAAERNALRLNRAIRVLAETSEAPEEVRLELNARTAHQQHRLAKRVQAEIEHARHEELRTELAARRAAPEARRARARRRVRLTATALLVAGVALAGLGVWSVAAGGTWTGVAIGCLVALVAVAALQRQASVAARQARRIAAGRLAAEPAAAAAARPAAAAPAVQDVALEPTPHWSPRPLPRPLSAEAGSRAAREIDARAALARQAREEELRRRLAELVEPAPAPITAARIAPSPAAEADSRFASMGYVDDAEIEEHVRALLTRRAVGA